MQQTYEHHDREEEVAHPEQREQLRVLADFCDWFVVGWLVVGCLVVDQFGGVNLWHDRSDSYSAWQSA
jgi:hypothetical protein